MTIKTLQKISKKEKMCIQHKNVFMLKKIHPNQSEINVVDGIYLGLYLTLHYTLSAFRESLLDG